jgi:hypothetical protein
MSIYRFPMQQLIESPRREELLDVLEQRLLPRVRRELLVTERDARRPLGYDVVGTLRDHLRWGETAPLDLLSAVAQMYLFSWMMRDEEFRIEMMGTECADSAWWRLVKSTVVAWQGGRRVDWPATPLHPQTGVRYEPRLVPVERLVELLDDLFIMWES